MPALIVLYFWLLPFQWALSPAEGIDLALSRVLAALIILVWAARSLARRRLILPDPLQFSFLLSFLAVATASLWWADNREWAMRKIIFLWTFLPLFVVFFFFFKEKDSREKFLRAFAGGAGLAALVGIAQFSLQFFIGVGQTFALWTGGVLPFFLGSSFGGTVANYPSLLVDISGTTVMRASAFFPDPHMLALYLGLAIPIVLALALKREQGNRGRYLALFSVLLLADLLTFSRGGYLGLGAGLACFSGCFFFRSIGSTRRLIVSGIVIFLLAGALFASPFGTRLLSSFSATDGSNTERLRLWQETAGYIAEQPLFGTGIGNYPLLAKPSAAYREPIYAHNLFLDIAAEVGLVGLLFFAGFLIITLSRTWSRWRKDRDILALAFFASLIIFSAHSLFELPLFSVQVLPAFLLVAALASVRWKQDEERRLF